MGTDGRAPVSRLTAPPYRGQMSASVRAVCFDFDGTLAYMQPSHFALYVQAAREHGVAVAEQALAGTLDVGWQRWQTPLGVDHAQHSTSETAFRALRVQLHRERLAAAGVREHLDAIAERVEMLERDPAHYRLFDDVAGALKQIAVSGARAAIVSNHLWSLPHIVDALGIGAQVSAVVTSARVGYRKPHPAIYRAALEALHIDAADAADVLFVGDSAAADVAGPRAAGMRAVLLARKDPLPPPDPCGGPIRSLRDLTR